ncbi:antA/AntB antirepressor family protein [Enterobacter cloacae]|uniref:antA/AntB antirepressor family protein n=1 Tax=Enterobacter cloacae TaxID=550 RepID=UPI00300ECFB5
MTTQLIPVFDGSISNEKTLLCDARELHLFLGVRKDFSSWIRERIAYYGFIENEDFILLTHFGEQRKGRGGHNRKDYHLTIHTAKELAMVERNDKGRQIRRYFIECERMLKQQTSCPTRQGNYAVITYFENGLPVACHPLMPGEVVMNPDSCLEHVIRSGYVVMPCDEAEKFTLGEIQEMIAIARHARDRWLQP